MGTINRATFGPLAKRHPLLLLPWADMARDWMMAGLRLNQQWFCQILKRLRKRGHGFKSHLTDWEKPGIKPGAPGIQGICYRSSNSLVCGRVPWL